MSARQFFDMLSGFATEMLAAPGDVILQADEPAQGVYLVTSGRVCSSILNEHGVPVCSRQGLEGAILGLASAVAGTTQMFTIVALEPTRLRYIRREKLTKLVRDNTTIAINLVAFLSAEEVEMRRAWSQIVGMPPMR